MYDFGVGNQFRRGFRGRRSAFITVNRKQLPSRLNSTELLRASSSSSSLRREGEEAGLLRAFGLADSRGHWPFSFLLPPPGFPPCFLVFTMPISLSLSLSLSLCRSVPLEHDCVYYCSNSQTGRSRSDFVVRVMICRDTGQRRDSAISK